MEKLTLTPDQARYIRMKTHRLLDPEISTPRVLLDHLVAVQAQEIAAGRLQMRLRNPNLTLAQIDHARRVDRSIVWGSFFRGTLHLVPAEDALWIIPLLKPSHLARDVARLRQLGWDENNIPHGVDTLLEAMKTHGQLTYAQIRETLADQGLPYRDQAHVHLLYYMSYHGLVCRGDDDGRQLTYTLLEDRIGPVQPLPKEEALARLAHRYLTAYAPATLKDFMTWSGLPGLDVRAGWKAIEGEMIEVEINAKPYRLLKSQLHLLDADRQDGPLVHLLPRFDLFILGYYDRELILPPDYRSWYNSGGGVANAMLLVNGRVKGVWYFERSRKPTRLVVEPFEALSPAIWDAVSHQTEEISLFLDEKLDLITPSTPGWVALLKRTS